jgi:hypothetical protein
MAVGRQGSPPKTELLSCPRVKLQREGQSFVGLAKIHFSDCAQKRFVRFCFGSQSSPSVSHIGESLPRLWLPCAFSQRQAPLSIYPALTGITWHLSIQRHARFNSVWYSIPSEKVVAPAPAVTAVTQEGGTGAQPAREDRLAKDKTIAPAFAFRNKWPRSVSSAFEAAASRPSRQRCGGGEICSL